MCDWNAIGVRLVIPIESYTNPDAIAGGSRSDGCIIIGSPKEGAVEAKKDAGDVVIPGIFIGLRAGSIGHCDYWISSPGRDNPRSLKSERDGQYILDAYGLTTLLARSPFGHGLDDADGFIDQKWINICT